MTENGAIKYFYKRMELGEVENDRQQSAYIMAIDALEEIQKYRELGTVEKIREELDRLRTDNECQGLYFTLEERQDLARQHKELEAYKALGTIEELSITNEKQIPKKPIMKQYFDDMEEEYLCCPTCGEILTDRIPMDNKDFYFHCLNCGQKLDWSDTN